jgi:hypothetical protein
LFICRRTFVYFQSFAIVGKILTAFFDHRSFTFSVPLVAFKFGGTGINGAYHANTVFGSLLDLPWIGSMDPKPCAQTNGRRLNHKKDNVL